MNLQISLRSEILKTKRTAAFYFTLIGAAVIPVTYLVNAALDGISDIRNDPFNAVFNISAQMNGLVIFPMFVILVCTLMQQLEYRNNTWKQVFTSPQSKADIYIAKFLNIHLLLLLFHVATIIFMFVAALATHFLIPELRLLHQPLDINLVLENSANSYVTALAMCTIQFWLGLRIKNFIVPIAVGLALWLTGTLMVVEMHASYTKYFPYSFHVVNGFPKHKADLSVIRWNSLGYAVLFLVLGFLDFRRRRMSA
jgi:hypothetical protein